MPTTAAPADRFLVLCADRVDRRPEGFANYAGAVEWAEWGHGCTHGHLITRESAPSATRITR